jgi:hypothetical protein
MWTSFVKNNVQCGIVVKTVMVLLFHKRRGTSLTAKRMSLSQEQSDKVKRCLIFLSHVFFRLF